jgi:glycosyltransferase involved in cell wall biosynthesis
MIGTSVRTMGGIASVIRVYDESGLLRRFDVRLLETHTDGSAGAKLTLHLRALVVFLGLLARGRVGLLHVHSSSRASFWRTCTFMLPAIALRVPVVFHLHGSEFDVFEKELGPARRRVVRWVLDHATVVVVLSSSWRRWVESVSSNRWVEVVPNPVLAAPPGPAARDRNVVLTLGRLGHRKGSYVLLEAAARLAGRHRVTLRLAGDGDLDGVAARAAELGVDAEVLGWIGPEERARELSSAGLFALPSYAEGLPMALLEAMAAGLPVVATTVGGFTDVVTDGVEGFLVEPGDVEGLAERIDRLLDDPRLAARMGAAAKQRAADFSPAAVVPRVEEIYEALGFAAC